MPNAPRCKWIVFVAGHADRPVQVVLDLDIYNALYAADQAAWQAVIEYIDGHIKSREES